MQNERYVLRYLPVFSEDLNDILIYISKTLHNPEAAVHLAQKVERAILERRPFAESFASYPTMKKRKWPYYVIYVGKYAVYYVVIEHKIMEVRRILYQGRDRIKILDEE